MNKIDTPNKDTYSDPNRGSVAGSLYMVLAALGFALMLACIKLLGTRFEMHAYEITFWRVACSLAVLGGYSWYRGLDFGTRYPWAHFWRSLSGSLALIINFYVVLKLPIATASTLNNTSAIFLGLLSILLLKQTPSLVHWLSLALGFVGVILLLKPTIAGGQTVAMLLGLTSGALSGYAYLQVRELSLLGEPAWRIVFYFSLLATLMSGALSLWVGFSALTRANVLTIIALGVTALAGQLFMTYAYQVGRKFMVAALSYLTVAFAAVLGAVFFGERLDWLTVMGISVIVTGGILASKK